MFKTLKARTQPQTTPVANYRPSRYWLPSSTLQRKKKKKPNIRPQTSTNPSPRYLSLCSCKSSIEEKLQETCGHQAGSTRNSERNTLEFGEGSKSKKPQGEKVVVLGQQICKIKLKSKHCKTNKNNSS